MRAKSSYTRSCSGLTMPGRGRRLSGRSLGKRPWKAESSAKCLPIARALARSSYAPASSLSTSRTAFSVAARSMTTHPRSRLSATTTPTTCSITPASITLACTACSSARMWLASATRRGSLQVTKARLPARLDTIRCAALRMRFSSGSTAKSLTTSSTAVKHAMVTERSTTGARISCTPRSTAKGTARFRPMRSDRAAREGLITT
mmetsp:Transcript_8574/g.22976  ORF Transcript_8574/g.22976 Transcript_8574/m.22976 type:complete len:205 (-) Transcript_8574:3546-4160(-)